MADGSIKRTMIGPLRVLSLWRRSIAFLEDTGKHSCSNLFTAGRGLLSAVSTRGEDVLPPFVNISIRRRSAPLSVNNNHFS